MSLRDLLVAKGLASKKRARQVSRELKDERKKGQGSKKRKHQRQAAERAARETEEVARREMARVAAQQAAAEREEHERIFRIRDMLREHRLSGRGPVRFHYRVGDTGRIRELHLPPVLARDLRSGAAAIATHRVPAGEWETYILPRRAAERLAEEAPEVLVHWASGGDHLGDPSEAPLERTWESSITPHRVKPEELAALRERERARG